jgi:hypothetical protein
MQVKQYKTWVKNPISGGAFQVFCQAQSYADAKKIFEGMYGKQVLNAPSEC